MTMLPSDKRSCLPCVTQPKKTPGQWQLPAHTQLHVSHQLRHAIKSGDGYQRIRLLCTLAQDTRHITLPCSHVIFFVAQHHLALSWQLEAALQTCRDGACKSKPAAAIWWRTARIGPVIHKQYCLAMLKRTRAMLVTNASFSQLLVSRVSFCART